MKSAIIGEVLDEMTIDKISSMKVDGNLCLTMMMFQMERSVVEMTNGVTTKTWV